MPFPKLAAALALTALAEADEDRAVTAVTALRERASAAELEAGTLRTEVARLTADLGVQTALAAAAGAAAIDSLIADAYKSGKLGHGKDAEGRNTPDELESLLRDYGKTAGRDKLAAKLSAMPARIPVGITPIVSQVKEAERQTGDGKLDEAAIARTAASMGIPVDELRSRLGLPPLLAVAGGAR